MSIEPMLLTCRCSRPQQFLARLPFGGGIQFFEILNLAAGKQRYRDAVTIEQPITSERGELGPGRQEADKVEGISAGERHPGARERLAPHLSEHRHRVRQSELLTG